MLLPGLKRWIAIILIGITSIIFGVFLLLGYHPLTVLGMFIREILEHAAEVLPHRISGILVIIVGGITICVAIAKLTISILGAYLPDDRDSIPDVLYRRRHLDRGPKVVVIGGGTGLSTLLKGIKAFTNNITAIVTVGDDGGSSGRLRQEMGVLPPGDIRNCITALADEDKLVTELFSYRFSTGQGLEGHSFGNLFITALCAITNGDILEAVRVASRVLNSCGQVLPASLEDITLIAQFDDGREVVGESKITSAQGVIRSMRMEPATASATPEAISAILHADLIVLGPGSLYTSIIPNLLVQGVVEAIVKSPARKLYVCNVMTQPGETDNYSVADHIEAIVRNAGLSQAFAPRLIESVLVNDEPPKGSFLQGSMPVRYDPDRLRLLNIRPVRRNVVSQENTWRHDDTRLSKAIMFWFMRKRRYERFLPKGMGSAPRAKAKISPGVKV